MSPIEIVKDLAENIIWVFNFTSKVIFKKYNNKNSGFGCGKNFKKFLLGYPTKHHIAKIP